MHPLRSALTAFRRKSRLLQAALLVLVTLGTLGAADNTAARYDRLGHQMMCTCSCAQILVECNHLGCPDSPGMLATLRASLARGDSDRSIFETFQAKYGPTALAAPMLTRFNALAWIVPPGVLAFGLVGAILLIRRWRLAHVGKAPVRLSPQQSALRSRIRQETEL